MKKDERVLYPLGCVWCFESTYVRLFVRLVACTNPAGFHRENKKTTTITENTRWTLSSYATLLFFVSIACQLDWLFT